MVAAMATRLEAGALTGKLREVAINAFDAAKGTLAAMRAHKAAIEATIQDIQAGRF